MGKIGDYIQIIRPLNCFMMGFAVLVGIIIATNSFTVFTRIPSKVLLGFMTGFLLTGSSMVINDYIDVEIDRINEPDRPIPSGRISRKSALVYSIILGVLGILSSLFINIQSFVIAFVAFLVAISYNAWGKKTGLIGNMMVSFTVMIPLLFGSTIAEVLSDRIIVFSIIIFLANTGREITKGIVDIAGDRVRKVMTLAVKYGGRTAAEYAFSFYLAAVILSFLPYLLGFSGVIYLVLVVIVDIIIVLSGLELLRHPNKLKAAKVKRRVLYAMLLGLIAFALSGLP
jgi:geranylgeranylglycerol-phosphate geranylgeranyltransferase